MANKGLCILLYYWWWRCHNLIIALLSSPLYYSLCTHVQDRCHQHNKLFCLLPLWFCSQTLLCDRNLTIMNEFCVSRICVGCEVGSRSLWALTCRLQQWRQRGRLKRARKPKKKKRKTRISIHSAAAVSHLCLHAIYAVSDSEFFFSSILRWYFCLAGDVSGWTRSATLRGGQVSKNHESKTFWQAKTERGVWCG